MHWDLQTGNSLSKKKCVWLKNKAHSVQFHSVTHSCLTLLSHELQHARPPCPWPTSWVYSNSCPLNQWCHLTISSSVVPFSSCIQSFPASGIFHMSQLFNSGGQRVGVSDSASVLPVTIQDWFPLGWTVYNLLTVQGTLNSFLQMSSKASTH